MLNVIVRSVATIIIGVLLVMHREAILPIIVQCVGAVFILPGLFALVSYLLNNRKETVQKWQPAVVMLTSVGSIVFGLWLLLSPSFFIGVSMMLLGGLITLHGLYQITALILARKYSSMPFVMFIMPLTLMVLGLAVLVNPFDAASVPFLLLGIGAVVGGISDLINSLYIMYRRRKHDKENEDITEIIEP
ncbi:MAG: DUF308 domain-containing protein [Bacteroidaceae bacterium]|nr:DUF308 domain-containing protein [Bacteroidaceae bacterium]